MTDSRLNLFSFSGKTKILHLTWIAFFISFFVWFNHAPLLIAIKETLGLTSQQIKTLLILNVALTIPARIIIGMLVDKFGPKRTYATLLSVGSIPCFMFALADTFEQLALARFLLGFVGAGFVIGIRMMGEWFPAKQVGVAEGIYGGWGNFGSAAAAMSLPTIALVFGGDDGWRYAIGLTGVIALIYSVIYFVSVSDTPKGSTYFKPKRIGAMEVTSKGDLYFYILMSIPMYATLALLTWKLSPAGVNLLESGTATMIYIGIALLFCYNVYKIFHINNEHLKEEVPEIHRYKFKQVAILDLAYMVTFGSELAVVSMLPLFFYETFSESHGVTAVMAGLLASGFAFMNLVARPGGGLISDKYGRKKSLTIFLLGLVAGYFIMSQIESSWSLILAVAVTMLCSFFVQAGEGAVFAMVPLIKRRMTGQIAGMVGAYGNVGAVLFLTVLSFVSPQVFFLTIAGAALFVLVAIQFIDEPKGHMAEVLPDGTVEMIEVN
ncbi:MAG: NarK family nitrate/nitrite MFS transporter [gamma proteobacterium symbiont of Bathyaustriella thionipta]|nr:NarK family nitrate/nitrite MFS transporter [gamma proteobacterium symbiont of Bathyaustriella thionipta]MCU7950892.1 NarK family nitrate/nitrite MFS transporter [gamma proteobacterium symbiont of Bathyaustriella thionipta]MCU7952831.1 NarK family nitrate/nitrite MFS transporter [gamma proteobacterium symbiont of Bathyaustriella thionipta]MCU7957386.1 NarK family nitrate/nitrite MFS transporter [gamma proteobacterium symbiont of Bathyaustriella thionipta]MCU7967185.1 NarK family nitrate/nitr